MAGRLAQLGASVDPILTTFAVGYKDSQFIAKQIIPTVRVLTHSGTFYTLGKEGFYLYDTERALRANANKANFEFSSDTYTCERHAFETSLDYEEINEAQKYGGNRVLQMERRATKFTQMILERKLEKKVADIVFSATYYASGNKVTLTGDDQWSSANSDPLGQIETAIKAARADMFIEPNELVLGYDSYWALATHAQIKAMVSDNKDKQIRLTGEDLAALLKIEKVVIGKSGYATDAGVWTDLWTDSAALLYNPPDSEMIDGTTPHSIIVEEEGYPKVRTYDQKKVRDYETERKYVIKNISTSYGYLISDCVA